MSSLKIPTSWDVKFNWVQCFFFFFFFIGYSVLKVITIRWSQFQSVSKRKHSNFHLIWKCGWLFISTHLTRESTASTVLTKCWNWELMLATNCGNPCTDGHHGWWPTFWLPTVVSQIAKFMGPTWGPPGSCRPQMGPMLAPWTLLSGFVPDW